MLHLLCKEFVTQMHYTLLLQPFSNSKFLGADWFENNNDSKRSNEPINQSIRQPITVNYGQK